MTSEAPSILEQLLRGNDAGWMIDMYEPRDAAIPVLLNRLDALSAGFRSRFGYELSFAPEILTAEAERNPHKIRAFLQALGESGNPEMLLMTWRILEGWHIHEVVMNYREEQNFSLNVTLAHHEAEPDRYSTNDIRDASLLRHFGILTVNGTPLFDGFFPHRPR